MEHPRMLNPVIMEMDVDVIDVVRYAIRKWLGA